MVATMDEDLPLRPTGCMERFNITRHAWNFYNKVQITTKYTIPASSVSALLPSPSPTSFRSLIYSCLDGVVQSQSMLGVTIQDEKSKMPTWKRLETIDFSQIVQVVDRDPDENPDAWIQADLMVKVDKCDELPLWRVVAGVKYSDLENVATGKDLKFLIMYSGHHVIADGLSCGAFHSTFLDALNARIASPKLVSTGEKGVVTVPKIPLTQSLEGATRMPLTFWYILMAIFKEFVYRPVDLLHWTGVPVTATAPVGPLPVRVRSFALPPAQVTALVEKCRAEKTSITALLVALGARYLGETYPGKHFTGVTPASMRQWSGHSAREMGVFVTRVETTFSSEEKVSSGFISCASRSAKNQPGDAQLWDAARKTRNHIQARMSSPKNQAVALLAWVADYKPFFFNRLGAKREGSFEVSNINTFEGGLAGKKEGKVYFDEMMFCGGLSADAPPYTISVATVKGAAMRVCIAWDEGCVSEAEGMAFTDAIIASVKEVIGS